MPLFLTVLSPKTDLLLFTKEFFTLFSPKSAIRFPLPHGMALGPHTPQHCKREINPSCTFQCSQAF